MSASGTRKFERGLCQGCGTRYLSRVGTFHRDWACLECGAPLCGICWRKGEVYCEEHRELDGEPASEERGEAASAAEPLGEQALDRRRSRELEDNFLSRLQRNLSSVYGIYSPLEKRWYEAPEKHKNYRRHDFSADEVRKLVQRHVDEDPYAVYKDMPLNGALICEVFTKDFFGGKSNKVIIAGVCVHALEELVLSGASQSPAGYHQLLRARERVACNSELFYYLGVFSPTGWSEEARSLLADGPNFLLCLLEWRDEAWHGHFSERSRWGDAVKIFDLNTTEEKVQRVLDFVDEHAFEVVMDECDEEFVLRHVELDRELVRKAFELMAEEDPFIRLVSPQPEDLGQARLRRVY